MIVQNLHGAMFDVPDSVLVTCGRSAVNLADGVHYIQTLIKDERIGKLEGINIIRHFCNCSLAEAKKVLEGEAI